MTETVAVWGILRRTSKLCIDGETSSLVGDYTTPTRRLFFKTRREAQAYVKAHYGYAKHRADLKAAPHGWIMPKVVRVLVTIEIAGS